MMWAGLAAALRALDRRLAQDLGLFLAIDREHTALAAILSPAMVAARTSRSARGRRRQEDEMHDPMVVLWTLRRPWPSGRMPSGRRYRPAVVTVWHVEPGGRDTGSVCSRSRREWHVHHWRLQVHPLQALRRRLLTRCAWCGGPDTQSDPVNVSQQWDGDRGRWWTGEPALFHGPCSVAQHAHSTCLCPSPVLDRKGWGQCRVCGRWRSYGATPAQVEHARHVVLGTRVGQAPSPETLAHARAAFPAWRWS